MNKWLLNDYDIKSGTKNMWFTPDDFFGYITVDFLHVRLKYKKFKELKRCVLSGECMEFSFIENDEVIEFTAIPVSITLSGKKKFNFAIESTGAIKYEQANKKD